MHVNKEFSSDNNQFFFILAPNNLQVGSLIHGSGLEHIKGDYTEGRYLKLKNIPSGTLIHNVETTPNAGGILAKAAGTSCTLIKTILDNDNNPISFIKLPSKKILQLDANCRASIGQVSRAEHNLTVLGKAGASR
jgi:large subunit ribosomal protein L2